MAIIKREKIASVLDGKIKEDKIQTYLFFGERYLCSRSASKVMDVLMEAGGTLHEIDGREEKCDQTLFNLQGFSLLPGLQIYRVTDSALFPSSGKAPVSDFYDQYIEAISSGFPAQNILMIIVDSVDKRKKLFKIIKEKGLVVDCSVAAGASAVAKKEQKSVLREVVVDSLNQLSKKIEPQAMELLFDRTGCNPISAVIEAEKLAIYIGDNPKITRADVDLMVSRTREDAIFELTEAFVQRKTGKTLVLMERLLDNGFHFLAILSSIRNYIRKMLVFRSLQLKKNSKYFPSMNPNQFQNDFLPVVRQENEEWKSMLSGHPFAVFNNFKQASGFSIEQLKNYLRLILKAEVKLKGSALPPRLVLEDLLLAMMK